MTAVVRRRAHLGFDAIELENSFIKAVILPQLGGRIWELWDKTRSRQWVWHRPEVRLDRPSPDRSYDDGWAGGWEQLFPNDAPGHFEGRDLPDHGEWWSRDWSVELAEESDNEAVVRLGISTRSRQTRSVKEFRLRDDDATFRARYSITSLETEPFHFLFKEHLPILISPGCRLEMPGGIVTPVDPAFGNLIGDPGPFSWPGANGVDLRVIPSRSSQIREFVYLTQTPEGWCGIDDAESGAAIRIRFERSALPYTWLFLSYGGWRDCYTAVLEPCTNMPKDLTEAVRQGRSAVLMPGQRFEMEVTAVLGGIAV